MDTAKMDQIRIVKPKRGAIDVHTFCGWPDLEDLIVSASTRPMLKGLMATLFSTGCRISECLKLTPEMFRVEGDWVMVYSVPVLKKGKHAGDMEKIRTVTMPASEPLVPYMLEWVEEQKKREKLFPYTRGWAYKRIQKLDPKWWPHRFRTERASQLVIEYGFNVPKLMKWFNWSDSKVPTQYVRLDVSDLKASMIR